MNGIDLNNHFSLNSVNDVRIICDPVLNPLGITYFNYIKIYNKDGSRELLTNNAEWIEHFYQHALYASAGAVDIEHLLPKGYFLWSELNGDDPVYLRGRDLFNIDNGITFVIKREDVTFLYIFASSRDRYAINNFYLSHIDLLQHFVHYFNDQAHELLTSLKKNRIFLPQSQIIDKGRVNNIQLTEYTREDFFRNTQVKRYFLINESDEVYLTPKQVEYASYLIKGLTAKQIAKEMAISHRTAEGYLSEIKHKLQELKGTPLSKAQILQILRTSNLK